MSDDVDILREVLRSVYLTARQKEALRRVLGLVSRGPERPALKKTTDAGTPAEKLPSVIPLLGPGEEL